MIREHKYRTCSPVIKFKARDRVTNKPIGADLLSVALTNDPFLDGLHPIQLTWTAAMSDITPEQKKADKLSADAEKAKAMAAFSAEYDQKQKVDATPVVAATDATTAVAATAGDVSAIPGEPPEPAGDDVAPDANDVLAAAADAAGMSLAAVVGLLGDQATAFVAWLQSAATDGTTADAKPMTDKNTEVLVVQLRAQDSTVRKLTATVEQLKQDAAVLRKEADARAAADKKALEVALTARVAALVESGNIEDEEQAKKDAVFLFTNAPDIAERQYSVKRIPLGGTVAGQDPNRQPGTSVTTEGLTEDEETKVLMMTSMNTSQEEAEARVKLMRGGLDYDAARKKYQTDRKVSAK